MKVAVFGATGATGRIMIRPALERGHELTAAARNPSLRSQGTTNGYVHGWVGESSCEPGATDYM